MILANVVEQPTRASHHEAVQQAAENTVEIQSRWRMAKVEIDISRMSISRVNFDDIPNFIA